jgi:hypothetical protein
MAHGICPLDGQAATAHGKKKPGILCRAKRLVVLGILLWVRSKSASMKDICDLTPNNCAATSSPEALEPGGGRLGVAHRVLDVLVSEIRLKGAGAVGRCTASAIASASRKSFFCPLLSHVFGWHQPGIVAE